VITTVAHVCDQDLPAALRLLASSDLAARVSAHVIGLAGLVPDGLEALVARRATGKVLIDPWR
jgi:(R,R)-butanediol dehydrogenase/meso-butanediol dehydrogenase/diacetyl reductase